ncbi:MAG TPA: ferrochelatase [Candidatus Acidoferrum sp.]|nr:ferrochelatase [Candidatus Acidoferrum sp.]
MNKGILLVNLGSPDSTSVGDVRRYLNEFLMDGRVIDAPWPLRRFIVGMVLINRPKETAHAYAKIWRAEGSPLVVTSRHVQAELQDRVPVPVELAMRYQNPSIATGLIRLHDTGVDDVLAFPLFPHYAMSSFESAAEEVKRVAARMAPGLKITIQPPFYQDPDYITALVASAKSYLDGGYDHLLFSYHGIPERHLRKSDTTGCHCLQMADCCNVASPAHATCYRAQCFKTVELFVQQAGIPKEKYSVSFQSRLGKDPWLKPYTDFELVEFPKRGIRKLLVMCPAFVSDCLETMEEINMRGRETFLEAGGKEFNQIPCLNEEPLWIDALGKMAATFIEGK